MDFHQVIFLGKDALKAVLKKPKLSRKRKFK